MNNNSSNLERCADADKDNLQKPDIYLRHLPCPESITQQAFTFFEKIRENLSRTIQVGEYHPGFILWSKKLKEFISLYGFSFTRDDHIKLIKLYLSIISSTDISYSVAQICFDSLIELLQKIELLTRDDLTIDWRIFYRWVKRIKNHQHKTFVMVPSLKEFETAILYCTQSCSPYFSSTATQELLDEFRPHLCPFDRIAICDTMQIFDYFLPMNLPPHLHDQGFKLWLPEFFNIWENINNETIWEAYLVNLFSRLAWYNIGYIDWTPWLNQIFTHFLRGFSLPIGKTQKTTKKFIYSMGDVAQWIVAMIGNGSSCLDHLQDLLTAVRSFYYPSNTGYFQKQLVDFLFELTQQFVNRVHLERQTTSIWFFAPHESSRLTEQDITDFVNCIKEYVFISIFNKDHSEKAAEICQDLSILRPELIVPTIVDKLFISIDDIDEAHRFTSLMYCVTRISRQLVRQSPSYSQGQTYVVPLLLSVLTGIDVNDIEKTSVTIDFIDAILMLITCVDCSSATEVRTDLTEVEKEVCLSTAMFEEFITRFLNETFEVIDSLSTDYTDASIINEHSTEYDTFQRKLISIVTSIAQQCSTSIFQIVRQKIINFVTGSIFSSKVRSLAIGLVRAIVKCHPEDTLKYLLPQTCQTIEKIFHKAERNLLHDHKGDQELTWYICLFAELLQARGDVLLEYKEMIQNCFHSCVRILHIDSYETVALAIKYLLQSLINVYPIDSSLIIENLDGSFADFLPIRAWGQSVDFDRLQVRYHIPTTDEVNFACEFVNDFLYAELSLLSDMKSKLAKEERRRSLTIIHSIAVGCFRIVPRIESKTIEYLSQSMVSFDSPSQSRYSIYYRDVKPNFHENLRMRLLLDIGKLLDKLIEIQSHDVLSIRLALSICVLSSEYYGIFAREVDQMREDIRSITSLVQSPILGKRDYPRFLSIKQLQLQIEAFELHNFRLLTETDQQIGFKLFDLSISRHSEIRSKAQEELFHFINHYNLSWIKFLDRIVEQLSTSNKTNHHQVKGCLYILLGNDTFFLPTKHSWSMMSKIWPLMVKINHTNRLSIQNLIERIRQNVEKDFEPLELSLDIGHDAQCAAVDLWHELENDELERSQQIRERQRESNLQSYHHLIDTLHSLLRDETLTWGQEKIAMSFLHLLLRKDVPLSASCVKTCVDFLIHDNAELREYAFKIMTTFCRIQKPPRIFIEKSIEEIFRDAGQSLAVPDKDQCQPGAREDNLWITFNDYELPKTQDEWEQTCFLDDVFYGYYQWPKTIKYAMNKRERYTINNMPKEVSIIFNRFMDKNFVKQMLKVNVNNENTTRFDRSRFEMFKALFRNFGLAFVDNFLEELTALMRKRAQIRQEHRLVAEIIAGMIRGSKYWTLEMLDTFWQKLTPFLNEVIANLNPDLFIYWGSCLQFSMEDQDPRRMFHAIEFTLSLIDNQTWVNTFNEASRWYLVQSLAVFQWRIPSIWCTIYESAKELIDHPSKLIRQLVTVTLPLTLKFDLTLFEGKSTYHPTFKQLIEDIRERLDRAIAICESKSRINHAAEIDILDNEVSQALSLIQSVIAIQGQLFALCHQPIRDTTLQMFSYFCDTGSIMVNDDGFRNHLAGIRTYIGMAYLHTDLLEALIEQVEHVCTKSKWQARLAAMEFIQYFVFCNLFNIRPYLRRLHKLVVACLFDDRLEVRLTASMTLSVFYQCSYTPVTDADLKHFRLMSKTPYRSIINGEKVVSTKDIVKRHGGILGLCAIIQANPYDIPAYVPDTLMILCEHSHDPHLIQRSIKQCLSEFRRTHHDSWHEHRMKFTGDQLGILADVLISHNYYV
ncbi:unnamed protein product [Adineta ricciae]|uniref:Proteasome activator complex subunit 4 n=1 Tax=Adineta ricciae TaxID=249248 RepID=A0A814S371_ADIRI|nr:unnamed protein product [Adineta ricciae]